MFVGDVKSKLESFGCAKKNTSGSMLKNIQKQLKLIYLNNEEHTHAHRDRANGNTDLLDMAFVSPNPAKQDIQFQIGEHLGSDYHLPMEISIDATPHRNSYADHTKYKFDQIDREVFESTLEAALDSEDFSGLTSTDDPDKYADFIVLRRNVGLGDNTLGDNTRISQLRKQVKEKLRVGTQTSWEKFCNSVSLESDPSESWRNQELPQA